MSKNELVTEDQRQEVEYTPIVKCLFSFSNSEKSKCLSAEITLHDNKIMYEVLNRKTRDASYFEGDEFYKAVEKYNLL